MEKIKNLPVFRMLAFAVALALILGICSVFLRVTASADTVTNGNALDLSVHQIGSLGKYPVIGLPSSGLLADYIATSDSNSTNSIVDYFVPFTVYNGVVYYSDILVSIFYRRSYFDNLPTCTINLGGQIVLSTIYDSIKAGSDTPTKSTDYRYLEISAVRNVVTAHYTTYPNDFYKCTYAFKSSKGDILSDTNVSSIMYARVLTSSYNATVDTNSSSYIKDTDSFADMDSLSSPKGKFVTCASFTNDDGSFPLWCKSFVAEGQQYPLFTYFIKDNGNKHKYSLVLSYNNNDVAGALCTALYDNLTNDMWRTSLKIPSLSYVSTHIFPMHNAGDMMVKAAIKYFESGWKNATFSQSFNLSGSDMDFSNSVDSGNKVYTLCLSDYSAIVAGQIYKVEIWDNTISEILDTTYFVSRDSFGKSNSGTGVKIYDYKDDGDRMEQDIINNTPSVTPGTGSDFKTTGDIEWSQFNDDLTNVDITSIFSSLHSAINSVGVFFQACWAIIPSSIFAILLSGLSLIIVLRVLGR